MAELKSKVDGKTRPWVCKDCGMKEFPLFMLKNEVWYTVADKFDMLCFACTSRRLKRPITWDDMKPCPMRDELLLGLVTWATSSPHERIAMRGRLEELQFGMIADMFDNDPFSQFPRTF